MGWDFIQANRLQLVIDRGIYYLSGPHGNLPLTPVYENSKGSSETLFQSSTLGPVPVKLTSAIVVPPMSEFVIKCSRCRLTGVFCLHKVIALWYLHQTNKLSSVSVDLPTTSDKCESNSGESLVNDAALNYNLDKMIYPPEERIPF